MSDLSPAIWKEIEEASFRIPIRDPERFISIGKLRTIIKKSRRSNDQNALLWALYSDAIAQGGETLGGWTTEDIHEFALGSYFGWERCDAFGMRRQKPKRRSSRLSKTEFADFVDAFVRLMAQHGIVLKLPGDRVL